MLIPVSDEKTLRQNGIYFKPSTLRKWHHLGKYPEIFIKLCSRLFIDLDKWRDLVEKAKADRERDLKSRRLQ